MSVELIHAEGPPPEMIRRMQRVAKYLAAAALSLLVLYVIAFFGFDAVVQSALELQRTPPHDSGWRWVLAPVPGL